MFVGVAQVLTEQTPNEGQAVKGGTRLNDVVEQQK